MKREHEQYETKRNKRKIALFSFVSFYFICFVLSVESHTSGPRSTSSNLKPGRKYSTLERLKTERLRAVHEDRLRYQSERKPVEIHTGYQDYRAILHAHAEDSTHTGGSRPELLSAAKETGVRILLLSDHVRPPRDFINGSWRGMRDGVLFIPGAEAEGFIVHPTRSIIKAHIKKSWKTREEYIKLVKQSGGNILLSHVEDRLDWVTNELDGMEIYNHHTDIMDEVEFIMWLRGSFTNPDRMKQIEDALAQYPLEFFGASQDYLAAIIAKWDRDSLSHRLTGIAANDCHHNQVYTVTVAGPEAIEIKIVGDPPRKVTSQQSPQVAEMVKGRKEGELIAKLDFDPYERSLSYVTTHLLLRRLEESAVRDALRQGRAYVAHDWLCDPTGFAFIAELNGKLIGVIGDEVKLEKGMRLRIAAPVAGIIKLIRNGTEIKEVTSDKLDFPLSEAGVYRIEVWLEIDGEQRPWIYANPIRTLNGQ